MRRQSAKHRRRAAEAKEFRETLVRRVGKCELCGTRCGELVCHEIAAGSFRLAALDKPYALLVLGRCHDTRIHGGTEAWPYARQLALLKRSRPADLDLPAFCRLIKRADGAITEADIERWENR